MTFTLPRPTGTSVRNLHERLSRDWSPRIAVDESLRDLVHQRNKIERLPESQDRNIVPIEVHSGRSGGVIDHANGLVMANPSYHAEPISLTTEDTREAEQVERVCAQLFLKHLLANDFWPSVGRDVLIYGRAFIKAMPMPSVWTAQEGFPVRGQKQSAADYLMKVRDWKESEGRFPFVILHVPAISILPLLDAHDNVLATIEEKWVTAKVLADEFQDPAVIEALSRRSLSWFDELPVVEYIDSEHVAYLRADMTPQDRRQRTQPLFQGVKAYKLLRTWRHNLGKHPVVLIPGIRTELQDYESHFKSFLQDAKESLELYDFLLSRLATMVYAYYLPSYEWKIAGTTAQFLGRDRPVKTVNLGGVTVTYLDEELKLLGMPSGLPDATILLSQLDENIQRHTLEDVLYGRVQGSAPAFQVALRINVAKSKLTPITQHMAQGLTNVSELFMRGVESLGEAVMISGEKITVSMAKKYRSRVAVSILPKSPVDRNSDIGSAIQALQFGMPWDWIVENILDVENPATLRLQKDIQEIEAQPPVKERLMTDALNQLDVLVQEDEFTGGDTIDLSQLPPEFAQALQTLTEQGGQGLEALMPPGGGAALPPVTGATEQSEGLGRGPYPPGSAPQTLSPRGLMTPKEQPAPGAVQISYPEGFGAAPTGAQ